jgi:type II secretory pathway pseudopilin PulG
MKRYYNAMNYAKLHHKQAGMTLIELTVVLLILIGLAGLLVPYVGSFVQKTHDSTNSSNLAQLNNAFIRYVTENNRLPQHMDTLTNDASGVGTGVCDGTAKDANGVVISTATGSPYCGLLDTTMFAASTYTVPMGATPTGAAEIGYVSLANSKISMLVENNTTAANKTFGSYSGMIMVDNSMMGNNVNTIHMVGVPGLTIDGITGTEAHLAVALGKAPMDYDAGCYDYVAFGLGDANGLVTKTIASSPVNYPEDATKGPVDYYNHYMAIVRVDKSNTATDSTWNAMYGTKCSAITETAKFLGVVMNVPHSTGSHLIGVNSSLGSAYENQLAGK